MVGRVLLAGFLHGGAWRRRKVDRIRSFDGGLETIDGNCASPQ